MAVEVNYKHVERSLIFMFLLSLTSCESTNETSEPVKIGFTQILEDLVVTPIAFDKPGNAWIGTFE